MHPALFGVVLIAVLIDGCQTGRPIDASVSYVEPVPSVDAKELGRVIARYVGEVWPGARTTVLLVPPLENQSNNELTQALTAGLLENGFAVITPETQGAASTHRLQYWVTPLDGHALVRLVLDGSPATCLYAQDLQGHVVALAPITVRN
jgi:hypothetical protein